MLGSLLSGVIGGYALAATLLVMGHPPHVALLALSLGGTALTLVTAALILHVES
jgi:hypothetical protein